MLYYQSNVNESKKKIASRLAKIWATPDFTSFFALFSKRPPLKIKKGQIIFYEGDQPDKLYFIKDGYVKLYHPSEEGRDAIIYLYGPGTMLGVRALTSEDRSLKHNAEAITNVEIITIPRTEYLEIVEEHPEYLVDLLHIFIERLNHTEQRLEGFILTDSISRVASFLSECAKRFGVKKNNHIVIPIPLTHQRISEFVGSFRETVTVAISKLEKEKIIEVEKGKVKILNLDKLANYDKQRTHKGKM